MKNSNISWTDHTHNHWIGCTEISPGCDNCYARELNKRFKYTDEWGKYSPRKLTSETNRKKPYKWNEEAKKTGKKFRVFCQSLGDIFDLHPSIKREWRGELFKMIEDCKHLNWLLLTKRPQNIKHVIENATLKTTYEWSCENDHVWFGTTVESQEQTRRIRYIEDIPAANRFISCEPLIEPIDLYGKLFLMNWVIVGGESGKSARPFKEEWALDIRDQCKEASIPFFFKQHGGSRKINGVWGGDLLDGKVYHEMPYLLKE